MHNVNSTYSLLKPFRSNDRKKPNIHYRFRFVSLIPPYLLSDLRLLSITSTPSSLKKSSALMKQSYLLFTWFFYLKESSVKPSLKQSRSIRFCFLPVKRTLYTITKAPMAHKTNSKEQIQFRFFKFSISIETFFNWLKNPRGLHSGLYLQLLSKRSFPIFETNLLILKSYEIWLTISDESFYSLNLFLKK